MEDDPSSSLALVAKTPIIAPTTQTELVHTIWSLAWPVILTFLLESLVGLIDTLMVGRLGATAVAAVGVGAQVLSAVSVAMTAVGTGTLAIVARRIGARETKDAEHVLLQSILAAFVLSIVAIIPVIIFAGEIVAAFNVDANVAVLGGGFVRFVMLSIPMSALLFVIGSALRAVGDTRTPLAIGFVVNVINIALNYVLIFGKLGLPALGVRGSGLATTIAFAVGACLTLALLLRGRLVLRLPRHGWQPDFSTIRRVLAVGYPAAAEQFLMQIGFFIYLIFAARYGTSALAGYFIGVRILALSFLPGFGFAAAAAALVGQNLGSKNPQRAEHSAWMSTGLAVVMMSVCGVVLYLAATPIAKLFVDDQAVVIDSVSFIHALALSQPLMAIDFTLGGALRGAGDTKFPLISVLVAFYGCRLGWAYVVTYVVHASLPWLWAAIFGDYIARSILKSWRLKSGSWKHIRV